MGVEIKIGIIGGGVVGCFLALTLSRNYDGIYLFEKNTGITRGENQSSRNYGVLHAGIYYDRQTRPLKARLCVEGNRLWYEFCRQYDLPCLKTGKIIVAVDETESRTLDMLLNRAVENGAPGVTRIGSGEVRQLEPNVKAHSALLAPTTGVVDPTALLYKLYVLASNSGVQFITGTRVIGLVSGKKRLRLVIRYPDGREEEVSAGCVINSAGTQAVNVARMIDPGFPLQAALIRGDSMKFYRTRRKELYLNGLNVYPAPLVVDTPTGLQPTVGVHLSPTLDWKDGRAVIGDTVTVGPKLVPVAHLDDLRSPGPSRDKFIENMGFFPALTAADLEEHQTGVQARLNGYHDFYIAPDRNDHRVIHLVGIDSPGLTAAPAIAGYVADLVRRLWA